MIRIFLGGGGSEKDSQLLDEQFALSIDRDKPLVYIPNALTSRPYNVGFGWLKSVFNPLGILNIEMWDHLEPTKSIEEIAGIYIGGGNTHSLLRQLEKSKFDDYIVRAANAGIPIYGGSAGAIILGRDIKSAPEVSTIEHFNTKGLNLIADYSVVCHYTPHEIKRAKNSSQITKSEVIAIPELSGVVMEDGNIKAVGTDSVWIISENKEVEIKPQP